MASKTLIDPRAFASCRPTPAPLDAPQAELERRIAAVRDLARG